MSDEAEQKRDDELLHEEPASTEADEVADAGELEAARAKAQENWDLYLRAAAELENVRKRAARDVEKARKYGIESFGRELLGVVDSFEMGLAAAGNADAEALLEGSRATLKQLLTALERFGIEVVDPVGQPFDPELHEAISMQPSADMEPNSVLTAIQKGYTLNGRLLRPARVVVSTELPSEASDGAE